MVLKPGLDRHKAISRTWCEGNKFASRNRNLFHYQWSSRSHRGLTHPINFLNPKIYESLNTSDFQYLAGSQIGAGDLALLALFLLFLRT